MHFTSPEELQQLIDEIKTTAKTGEKARQMPSKTKPGRTEIVVQADKRNTAPEKYAREHKVGFGCCC